MKTATVIVPHQQGVIESRALRLASLIEALRSVSRLAYSDMRLVDECGAVLSETYWNRRRNSTPISPPCWWGTPYPERRLCCGAPCSMRRCPFRLVAAART